MSEIVTDRRTRRLKGQLTDLNLRNLTDRARPDKVADGNELHILVSPDGAACLALEAPVRQTGEGTVRSVSGESASHSA